MLKKAISFTLVLATVAPALRTGSFRSDAPARSGEVRVQAINPFPVWVNPEQPKPASAVVRMTPRLAESLPLVMSVIAIGAAIVAAFDSSAHPEALLGAFLFPRNWKKLLIGNREPAAPPALPVLALAKALNLPHETAQALSPLDALARLQTDAAQIPARLQPLFRNPGFALRANAVIEHYRDAALDTPVETDIDPYHALMGRMATFLVRAQELHESQQLQSRRRFIQRSGMFVAGNLLPSSLSTPLIESAVKTVLGDTSPALPKAPDHRWTRYVLEHVLPDIETKTMDTLYDWSLEPYSTDTLMDLARSFGQLFDSAVNEKKVRELISRRSEIDIRYQMAPKIREQISSMYDALHQIEFEPETLADVLAQLYRLNDASPSPPLQKILAQLLNQQEDLFATELREQITEAVERPLMDWLSERVRQGYLAQNREELEDWLWGHANEFAEQKARELFLRNPNTPLQFEPRWLTEMLDAYRNAALPELQEKMFQEVPEASRKQRLDRVSSLEGPVQHLIQLLQRPSQDLRNLIQAPARGLVGVLEQIQIKAQRLGLHPSRDALRLAAA